MNDLTIAVICAIEVLALVFLLIRLTDLPKLSPGTDWSKGMGFWPHALGMIAFGGMLLGIFAVIFSLPLRNGDQYLPTSIRPFGLGALDLAFALLLWLRLRYDKRLRDVG